MQFLFEAGVGSIVAADVDEDCVSKAKEKFKNNKFEAHLVSIGDNSILFEGGNCAC